MDAAAWRLFPGTVIAAGGARRDAEDEDVADGTECATGAGGEAGMGCAMGAGGADDAAGVD